MYKNILTKKDILTFNQQVGEKGELINEGSLDFALKSGETKGNWLYELSYIVRSLLVDHVFRDGNKRTGLLVVIYYLEQNQKEYDRERLLKTMTIIAKENITNPVKIGRLLYHVVTEKDNETH